MKKKLALVLSFVMVLALAACGANTENAAPTANPAGDGTAPAAASPGESPAPPLTAVSVSSTVQSKSPRL